MDAFDYLLDEKDSSTLFSTPNMPVGFQDHFIGLHASTLVRDGGTLQIGIGSMGDALTAALLARQADNEAYRLLLTDLDVYRWAALISREGGVEPFAKGLYGCSEMFVNGLLVLADAGIVRRKVYPDVATQEQANAGLLDDAAQPDGISIHGGFSLAREVFTNACRT
jgi:acyl-CoA hydrolase